MKILIIKKFHIRRTVKRWTRKPKVRLFLFRTEEVCRDLCSAVDECALLALMPGGISAETYSYLLDPLDCISYSKRNCNFQDT